jgi:hydroxymethylpyrimidine/phosphomethylpyrimidine kinase
MASINLTELHTTGSELFQDSESFLNELNNVDESIHGGGDGYSSATAAVLAYGIKGFEFGAITFGIDAIGHLVKSFSSGY